jgi:prepilin-type processing-associated H-X9-DG protein
MFDNWMDSANRIAPGTGPQDGIGYEYDHFGGMPEFNHVPGGCNVLYLDGHVEWVRFPGEYPCPNPYQPGAHFMGQWMAASVYSAPFFE